MQRKKAEELVKSLVDKAFLRFKQEITGENDEFLDRVIRQFRAKVARHIWRTAQKWCMWDEDGPVLMPDHTRIYYRKGKTEITVMEYPPQVRMLKFRGALARRANSTDHLPSEEMMSVHHFSLALPYVIFIFKFINGTFTEVKCAFCDRPLKRLEERPLRPYMSNIDTTLGVCLGTSFERHKLESGNLAQQMALVLDHFWSSTFTDEWSTHFWNTRRSGDERLESLEAWELATEDNPLFVVEDVNWLQYQEETFGDILVRTLEDDRDNVELHEELYSGLVDEFFEEMKKNFAENISSVAVSDALVSSLTDEFEKVVK